MSLANLPYRPTEMEQDVARFQRGSHVENFPDLQREAELELIVSCTEAEVCKPDR